MEKVFQKLELYPELQKVLDNYEEIKEELFALKSKMICLNDVRVNKNVWNIFPLLPEEEDRIAFSEDVYKKNQLQAPKATKVLSSINSLKAYCFSSLSPKGHIRPHKHDNLNVTAILCFQDGGNSFIKVNGKKAKFKNKEFIIFDYTKVHEVFNNGLEDRIVLLMLLDNRLL